MCPLERRVRTLLVTGHRSNPHGRLHSATIQRQRRAPMREHAIDEKRSSNGRKASAVHIDSDQTLDLPMAVDDARIQAPGLPRPSGYHDLHLLGSTLSSNAEVSGEDRRAGWLRNAQSIPAGLCPLERPVRTMLITGHRLRHHRRLRSAPIQRRRRAQACEHEITDTRASNGNQTSSLHIDSDQNSELANAVDDARIQVSRLLPPPGSS